MQSLQDMLVELEMAAVSVDTTLMHEIDGRFRTSFECYLAGRDSVTPAEYSMLEQLLTRYQHLVAELNTSRSRVANELCSFKRTVRAGKAYQAVSDSVEYIHG